MFVVYLLVIVVGLLLFLVAGLGKGRRLAHRDPVQLPAGRDGLIFLASWLAQSVAGRASYHEARLGQLRDPVSWTTYVLGADFWERTLQNWQSEFLAVGSMAVLSIDLRQRGSPESKPVGASHDSTGEEG
jgi:hypothetical protein